MKTFSEFLVETKNTTFTNGERQALEEILGMATGNLGEDADIAKYKKFIDNIEPNEIDILNTLYTNVISDYQTYKTLKTNLFSTEEIGLLSTLLAFAEGEGLLDGSEYEISNILDKLS